MTATQTVWWQNKVVYQIYPRSFQDSNGDGVGDVRGITSRLDYLAGLGVDILWLSPIYKSPQDDNGYDISDYQDIDPLFGTLADVDELIAEARKRNIKIVMDLVVNHSSDEHAWFVESRSSRDNAKADWYIWKPAKPDGSPPNNWASAFSGSAWEWDETRGEYYLHLFSKKQPDLNWENPELRAAVYKMMNWWLDRGIAGFRMDVITMISKVQTFPDGELWPGAEFGDGGPHFLNGPRLFEFLQEMHREVFDGREGTITVGECPGYTPEVARVVTDPANRMLDMGFAFDHVGEDQAGSKWERKPLRLSKLKGILDRWQTALLDTGWNSLFWCNHDQPRIVSRMGDDVNFRVESAKALATVLHTLRGTPYIYQGEEFGMTNYPFVDINDFADIETLNHFKTVLASGGDQEKALAAYRFFGRDNARTPVQWDASAQAGFTDGTPWLKVNPNFPQVNAAAAVADQTSVYHYYKQLIALRHKDDVLALGDYQMLLPEHEQLWVTRRTLAGQGLLSLVNLSGESVVAELGAEGERSARVLLQNYSDAPVLSEHVKLRPWEAVVYRW